MLKTVERRCVVCREKKPQNELIRVCKLGDKFMLDQLNKLDGRGAYVCRTKTCIDTCIKKRSLNRAFKMNIDNSIYELIGEYEQSL